MPAPGAGDSAARRRSPSRCSTRTRDLLVLDKAAGMVVHPAAGHARRDAGERAAPPREGPLRAWAASSGPGIVHRLDKDTSGCLVVAKHDRGAAWRCRRSFQAREVEKSYLALVHGEPPGRWHGWRRCYGRHPRDRKRFTGRCSGASPRSPPGPVRDASPRAALVEVRWRPGAPTRSASTSPSWGTRCWAMRSTAAKGKGDARVKAVQSHLGRQALHAWKLGFPHPRDGRWIRSRRPSRPTWPQALAALEDPQRTHRPVIDSAPCWRRESTFTG